MATASQIRMLRAIFARFPATITVGASSVAGMKQQTQADADYLPEGYAYRYSCTLSVVHDDLPGIAIETVVIVDGTSYRVEMIVDDSARLRRKLICSEV